jgi:hypothetical protein
MALQSCRKVAALALLMGVSRLTETEAFLPGQIFTAPRCSAGTARARQELFSAIIEPPKAQVEIAAEMEGAAAPVPSREPAKAFDGPWIFVEGLPFSAGEPELRSFFEGFEFQALHLPVAPANSPKAGSGKGTAMIKMTSPEEAERATALSKKEIMGRWITVERCMDPRESQTVKVRGVPFSATSQDLGRFFQGCGEVLGVTLSHDRNGVAYVCFAEPEGAKQALTLDGSAFGNRWLDVNLYLKSFRPPKKQWPEAESEGTHGDSHLAPVNRCRDGAETL